MCVCMDGIRANSCYSPVNAVPECREDRMVKIELEAAEALAGLAHSAVTENHGGGESMVMSEPVKDDDEMPPGGHSEFDSVPEPPNLSEDHEILLHKRHKKLHESISKPIKNEECSEAELNGTFTTSYASSGLGKARQYLTEAEKEARRIRRVLANRESARQTIRRRQTIYEELTRKAADLAWENENLKKEKEVAVSEYDSLRSINETLKAQMTEMLKVDAEESHPEIAPCQAESSPLVFYNQSAFFPFIWPQMVQQNPNSLQIQCGLQGSVVFPSPSSMLVGSELEQSSYDKGNSTITNSSGTPLYLLPCPWLFPLPQQSHGHQEQAFNLNDKPNEIPNTQYSPCSSAETVAYIESRHLLPVKVKAETSISQEVVPANNIHNNSFGFPPDGGGQQGGPRRRGNVLMPIPLRCVTSDISVEHDKNTKLVDVCEVRSFSTVANDIVSGVLEKSHEPMAGKKVEDVTAAANARKRRKELTKLKNLNCRPFRSALY